MRLLVIDPFSSISPAVLRALKQEGFISDRVTGTKKGIWMAKVNPYDVILLLIPSLSILTEAAKKIWEARPDTYVIALVTPFPAGRRVALLEEGLDEVIFYPCSLRELVARIRSLLRRMKTVGTSYYCEKIDDLTIDSAGFRVTRGEREISLRRKEFDLLAYLFRNSGRVITKTNLLEGVWDANTDLLTNTLEVHVLNLRRKIDSGYPPERRLIHTIYGRGYLFGLRPSTSAACASPRLATAPLVSK